MTFELVPALLRLPVAVSAIVAVRDRGVIGMATSAEIRRRSKRLEFRTTPEERELIERAAEEWE